MFSLVVGDIISSSFFFSEKLATSIFQLEALRSPPGLVNV